MPSFERTILINEEEIVSENDDLEKTPKKKLNPTIWLKTGVKSLARKCRIVDDNDDGKTNVVQTIFNMINANLGTGILAMPFVIRLGGYWGIVLTIVVGILGNYTGKVLISLLYEENQDGTRIRVRDSYADIGEEFNPVFGRYMVHVINGIEQFTHCVLLLIMPGTLIAHTFPKTGINESGWIGMLALIVIPSIFLRKMHQVTWTSIVSVTVAIIISLSVLIYSFTHRTRWSDELMPDFHLHITPISLGIIMVSYSSQAYLPAIERCMREPELFDALMDFSYTVVTVFKFGIGILVFLAFTDKTDQIMTLNLPHNVIGYLINIAAVILSLSFYPIPMFTVFDIIENQITLTPFLEMILDQEKTYCNKSYLTANTLFRLGVVILFITVGVAVPHFSLLMSFIGSTTGITLVLLYPCLFNLKINWNKMSNTTMIVNSLIVVFAIIGSVFGVNSAARAFYTVYNEKY